MSTIDTLLDFLKAGAVRVVGLTPTSAPAALELPDGTGVFLVHQDYKTEQLEGARRMKRAHTFDDVKSFAEWLKRHANPADTEVLVRDGFIDAALAPGIIDGDFVQCRLKNHPRFDRWEKVFKTPKLSQARLHSFLLAVGDDTAVATDSDGVAVGRQADILAAELRKIEVVSGSNFKKEIDERGTIRFSGSDEKTEINGRLPPSFWITVPVYRGIMAVFNESPSVGEATYRIQVRLGLEAKRDQDPTFSLTAPNLPIVIDTATDDAVKYLGILLGSAWLVGRGTLALTEVADRGVPGSTPKLTTTNEVLGALDLNNED